MRVAGPISHSGASANAPSQATMAATALYPVRIRTDMLTGIYVLWSYRRLHRVMTALDALMHAPFLAPPPASLSPCEYSVAASLWQLQWSIESQEARFSREMVIPTDGNKSVSLRAYVRGVKDRMARAMKRGLFDDLDEDLSATEKKRADEGHELMLEARACLTFAFAHDVRWRRIIMHPPGHLFDESGPDRDRAAIFANKCVELTEAFIDERLTLAEVAEEATQCWKYI